jgi:hypothetical protein
MPDLHPNPDKRVGDDEITPPYNRVEAIAEIKDALCCPLSWSEVFKIDADASFEPLDLLWEEILETHVKGSEGEYSGFMLFELDQESDEELRSCQLNVHKWREAARGDFCTRLRRFTDLRYASRDEYGKHLPPPGSSLAPDTIDDYSRARGVSIFYRDIPPGDALTTFLHAVFWSFSDDLTADVNRP